MGPRDVATGLGRGLPSWTPPFIPFLIARRNPVRLVPSAQSLTVSAIYHLSETGRKASLLAGGDGRGLQRLSVQVPTTRLHLVAVDVNGVARLKLQPRFELDGGPARRAA